MSILTDTFYGPSLDLTKWATYSSTVVGGRARCAMDWNYSGLISAASIFTVKDSFLFAKITPPAVVRDGPEVGMFAGSQLRIRFYFDGTRYVIYAEWRVGSSGFYSASFPYNAVNHAWWKIRESGGTAFFETSPDGLNWTAFHSVAFAVPAAAQPVQFLVGDYINEVAVDYTYIDNVNTPP